MIFANKSIVVTGGTGSLGKLLVKRILFGDFGIPKKIIIFSRDEAKQNSMRLFYMSGLFSSPKIATKDLLKKLEFHIGDVRNYPDVCDVIRDADIVINAAALKQVPSCEYFPGQALLTNCQGAQNIVRAIQEHCYDVETVVGVSTDKAVKPVNVMGLTKGIQEKIFITANVFIPNTRFVCVRYGNVLASRGSVIPLFMQQINQGGPVTLTVPEMTRFLLSINEAIDTIFAAIHDGKRGEIFIPDVSSATVHNIAKAIIGNKNIQIKITGIRPGEKMHEILISEEECLRCVKRNNYYVIHSSLPEMYQEEYGNNSFAMKGELSSANNVLTLEETVNLLKRHKLIECLSVEEDEELLV